MMTPRGCAFVPLGARARGGHAIRARAAGRDASTDPLVDRHPHAGRQATPPLRRHRPSTRHQQRAEQPPWCLQRTAAAAATGHSTRPAGPTVCATRPHHAAMAAGDRGRDEGTDTLLPTRTPSPRESSRPASPNSPLSHSSADSPAITAGADSVLEQATWLDAAARADILALTVLVANGFDNIGASHHDTKITALHLAAAQAREDCVCAIFELARGVGRAAPATRQRRPGPCDAYAYAVCRQVDDQGRSALHYAATVPDSRASSDQIDRTVRRLVSYGLSPWSVDYSQTTPLRLARNLGNNKAAKVLADLVNAAGA